jgi:hypothetical protein
MSEQETRNVSIAELIEEIQTDCQNIAQLSSLASSIEDNCNVLLERIKQRIKSLAIGEERIQYLRIKTGLEEVRTTHRKIRVACSKKTEK